MGYFGLQVEFAVTSTMRVEQRGSSLSQLSDCGEHIWEKHAIDIARGEESEVDESSEPIFKFE